MGGQRRFLRTSRGRAVPVLRAKDTDELGLALRAGVVVETDLATALECGAFREDCTDHADAFEASEDPCALAPVEASGDEA